MENRYGYLIATDYVCADGKTDVSDGLQQLIDSNPNRTIFFPDGTYLLRKPILTPAHPEKSVDLQLSNFAKIKASQDWDSSEAMIRLGASHPANDIYTCGSNYGINGGILDGSGIANGISIDGGRETYIRNVNIKNTRIGIHVKHGANSGSSDADIHSVNITGNCNPDSIGVLLEGYDNTLTNMRIAAVFTGVDIRSGGNMLRNIHPLFIFRPWSRDRFPESVGFRSLKDGNNWFDYCYSDQFAVSFHANSGNFHDCFAWWYSSREESHVALKSDGPFQGRITSLTIGGAHHPDCENKFMESLNLGEDAYVTNVTLDGKQLNF